MFNSYLNLLHFSSKVELDVNFIKFVSSSFKSDSVVMTESDSILQDYSKWKNVYKLYKMNDILNVLKNYTNKKIFIDQNISAITFIDSDIMSSYDNIVKMKISMMKEICIKNNLKITMIKKYFSTSRNIFSHYFSHFDTVYKYQNNILTIEKSRDLINFKELNIKNLMRTEKIKQIFKY